MISKAASRYAIALLETAKENKSLDAVLEDIKMVKETLDDSRELRNFLKSPIVKPNDKRDALASIFGEKVSKETSQFIKLVTEKGREDILDQITQAFIDVYNEDAGIITVDVRTARKLGSDQVTELTKMLEKSTSKKVMLNIIEREDLKGGMAVQINDTVIDATVKHKLEQLETKFLEASVE